MIKSYIRSVIYLLITWNLLEYIWHASRIILLSGDIETNPGPKHSFSSQGLTICHRNLNSLSSHMYNMFLYCWPTFLSKNLILCLSETYLNSETSPDDDNLEIPGYNIIINDHPSNTKRGGVCIIKTHYLLN